MDRYYKKESAQDCGTLYQLQCLIQRSNLEEKVTKAYHADAAFVDLVTDCHIVAAAMRSLKMESLNSRPGNMPQRMELVSKEAKARLLKQIARDIVQQHLFHTMAEILDDLSDETRAPNRHNHGDGVYNYATGFLKYGLLRRVSLMSTASADGLRALRHWRFALLAYHLAHKSKYRLEAFLVTAATKALLPDRYAQELIWSRFVNLTGGVGKNLDADYVLELFNGTVKSKLRTLGPNQTPEMVMKIARTVMFCEQIAKSLGRQFDIAPI